MQYAILCYNDEDTVWSMSQADDQAMMARLAAVQDRLIKANKMGASLRLLPTTAAATVRRSQNGEPLVIDGPFAETKEQLLGFFIVDTENLEEALDIARQLGDARTGATYEVRPIAVYFPDKRTSVTA